MAGWMEYEAIKRSVPLLTVPEYYRIPELRRSGKHRLRGRCPLHGGEGRETFHVETAGQIFHCFSCGAGGSVLDLVAATEHCGVRQAAEKLSGWKGRLAPGAPAWQTTVTRKIESVPPPGISFAGSGSAASAHRFEGIRETTAAEFGVGFSAGPGLMAQRLVILH